MSSASENCCDFAGNYDLSKLPEIKRLERSALGCDYGGTSWTTRLQVDGIVESLALSSSSRLLDIGSGVWLAGPVIGQAVGMRRYSSRYSIECPSASGDARFRRPNDGYGEYRLRQRHVPAFRKSIVRLHQPFGCALLSARKTAIVKGITTGGERRRPYAFFGHFAGGRPDAIGT